MDFTIYVLGDVRLFADTMNGIAMMFTVAEGGRMDLWASNTNGMGLGMGAFLGMLLAIISLIYNAAFRQRFDIRTVIIPLILYIVLTVPKVTVNIVDAYYAQGAQSVDNVPIGLALPMSAISSIAFSATEKLETIFSPPYPTATKITEDGFVMPLKLLHSMRYTSLAVEEAHPNVVQTISEIVKTCLTNNEGFDAMRYKNSTDGKQVFFDALNHTSVANRLVRIYSHDQPTGNLVTCDVAGTRLRITIEGYINSTYAAGQAGGLVSAQELKKNNLSTSVEKILASNYAGTGGRNVTEITPARMVADLQALTNATNDEALAFMYQTVFNPMLSTATECASGTDNRSMSRCLSYSSATEQWKEKSAAESSGFLSIMRDGQNLPILLSVTLFPIMVLIVVLQGLGGLKVVMSYLLYTISAYMWIPVAAMINWYVQLQMYDELMKWQARLPSDTASSAMLSLANAPLFYDALSKKLALANSVMASVPMICMGLFSGMLMTMNRLADKMNPASNFDASANTPAAVKRDAFSSISPQASTKGLTGTSINNSLAGTPKMALAKEAAQTAQQTESHSKALNDNLGRTLSLATAKGTKVDNAHQIAENYVKSLGVTDKNSAAYSQMVTDAKQSMAMYQVATELGDNKNLSNAEAEKMATTRLAEFNVNAGLISKLFGKDGGGGGSAGMGVAGKLQHAASKGLESIEQRAGTDNSALRRAHGETGIHTTGESGVNTKSRSRDETVQQSMLAAISKTATTSLSSTESGVDQNALSQQIGKTQASIESFNKGVKATSDFSMDGETAANIDNQTKGAFGNAMIQAAQEAQKKYGGEIPKGQDSFINVASNIAGNDRAVAISESMNYLRQNAPREYNAALASGGIGKNAGDYMGMPVNDGFEQINNDHLNKKFGDISGAIQANVDSVKPPTAQEVSSAASGIVGQAGSRKGSIQGEIANKPVYDATAMVKGNSDKAVNATGDTLETQARQKIADGAAEHVPDQLDKDGKPTGTKAAYTVQPKEDKGVFMNAVDGLRTTAAEVAGDVTAATISTIGSMGSGGQTAAALLASVNQTQKVANKATDGQQVQVKTLDSESGNFETSTMTQGEARNQGISKSQNQTGVQNGDVIGGRGDSLRDFLKEK